MIKYSLSLILLAGTLLAQESNSNDAKATLPELAVQGSSMGEIDLSRASILSGDTIESRKIASISDLSASCSNFMLTLMGNNHYGDVITLQRNW